ncbi:hypothetical protein DAI22_11g237800 [Oryza sativa Japonica Group]|nr:hypothetical protein DAI22_11g237800 [Oryza sativa Japonica Group]
MKFHAGGRPDCSLALKSWTKFPEAAVDGGQRPALKRGCDAVSGGARLLGRFELVCSQQTGTREDSASGCDVTRMPSWSSSSTRPSSTLVAGGQHEGQG